MPVKLICLKEGGDGEEYENRANHLVPHDAGWFYDVWNNMFGKLVCIGSNGLCNFSRLTKLHRIFMLSPVGYASCPTPRSFEGTFFGNY